MSKYKITIEADELDEETFCRLVELLKTFEKSEISCKPNSIKPLVMRSGCEHDPIESKGYYVCSKCGDVL